MHESENGAGRYDTMVEVHLPMRAFFFCQRRSTAESLSPCERERGGERERRGTIMSLTRRGK